MCKIASTELTLYVMPLKRLLMPWLTSLTCSLRRRYSVCMRTHNIVHAPSRLDINLKISASTHHDL